MGGVSYPARSRRSELDRPLSMVETTRRNTIVGYISIRNFREKGMPISRGDRIKVLCHIAGMYDEMEFVRRIKLVPVIPRDEEDSATTRERNIQLTREQNIKDRRRQWFEDSKPQGNAEEVLLEALRMNWPHHLSDPAVLLDKLVSVPLFLEECRVKYSAIETILSGESRDEWQNRHYRLHFMKTLNEYADDPKADLLLRALIGTYRLYRKHSVVPGILRENFVIKEHAYGHCEGTYIQYARGTAPNIIPFNVFYCGFYVMAFGAHKARGEGDEGRTEIITVSVLIQNTYAGGKLLGCDRDNKYFVGLLSGIYDDSNVLLSERVLIEKLDDEPEQNFQKATLAPVHIRSDAGKFSTEYRRVVDVIDNALDGQTLTARPNRRELVMPE